MGKYRLFGQCIEFSDAAERFYDMKYRAWCAISSASNDFENWYQKCGDIVTVLNGYENKAKELIIYYANKPLFSELTDLEIYDISEDSYDRKCLEFLESSLALDTVTEKYEDIVKEQRAKEEYRAERKANRGRVVGGGFGVGGALKGMATAGAMNAVTGAGHGLVNAVGNAGSALAAASSKRALYNNSMTLNILKEGIREDILNCFHSHMQLLNERKTCYIENVFDSNKATAFFENAKKVVEKQKELLIHSFENFPWSEDLLSFIFINYKTERKNIWNIGLRFHVDLHEVAEEVFAASYTLDAKESEEIAKVVRADILSQMKDFGMDESETLTRIEIDGLNRIVELYDVLTDDAEKQSIFDAVKKYDASQSNKATVIHNKGIWELAKEYSVEFSSEEIECILSKIYSLNAQESEEEAQKAKSKMLKVMETLGVTKSNTFDKLEKDCIQRLCLDYENADEKTCNEMIGKIEAYNALEKNKTPFIQKIRERIESIWSKEDGEIFDNLYMNTDIHNPDEIKEIIEIIQQKGRTSSSQKYVSALSACSEENIQKALKFQRKGTKIYKYVGFIAIALGFILWIADLGIILALAVAAIGIVLLSYYHNLKKVWALLTFDGTLIHKMLSINEKE